MDQRIAAVSALYALNKYQSPIPEQTVRHLRAILSSFNGEILSESEYEQLIGSLIEREYITRKQDKVCLTRQGAALAQAIGERILGKTAFDRLGRMVEDYSREPIKYIQNIHEQLKALQEVKENKVRQVNGHLIRVVGMVVELQYRSSELYRHSFRLSHQLMRNVETLKSEITYSARKVTKETGYPVYTHRDDDILQVVSPVRVRSFTLFGHELYPSVIETIVREEIPNWNLLLASEFMEDNLRELGYLRSRWPGRTFTRYQDFERVQTNVGYLRECESFNLDFTELWDDQVFVWIESFTSPAKRVLDFLSENARDTASKQAIWDCLGGLKLRSIPSGAEIELIDILPNVDLTAEEVPTINRTFAKYWEREYGIELTEKVQPILVVKGPRFDLHYPAEMVYIDRYSLEKRLGRPQKRETRPESPEKRYRKIQELFFSIRDLQHNRIGQHLEINLRRCTPTVAELCELGAFETAVRVHSPVLEFYGGVVSLDPLDIFNAEYVPVCGRKNISITHLFIPSEIKDADGRTFVQELNRMFGRYRFGRIQRDRNIKTIRYDIGADRQELESEIRNLGKVDQQGQKIAIAVIPDGEYSEYYYSLKRLLPRNTRTPLQCVRRSSFDEILNKRFRGFQYLCLKILIKSLKTGESIWNLSSAAGLLQEKTLFVGIGFSRYPRERKVSKCATVLHNARGDKVSWRVFATLQERTITKQWFDTLLRRIGDIVKEERPSRLVFYRTGEMYPQEAEAVKSSLSDCQWLSPIKVSFVSVMDSGNFRFYLYDRKRCEYQNLPAGYAIIVNDREAFLSTSNYDDRELKRGTVIPIHLRLEIGDDEIVDLVKEYHDLTYLNWQAPTTTAKHPPVVTIAERFSELTREGVSTESMFYLDL